MTLSKIFKKVLIPCVAGVTNNEGHTFGPNCVKKTDQGTKPSDLPIYSKQCEICKDSQKTPPAPQGGMEETVGNIRRELWVWQDNLRGYRHKIVDVYRKGFSKADSVIEYLRVESHRPQRFGAVALSGLAGYIFAMRKGRLRRFCYGFVSGTGMAAICYPNEAKDCLESVVLETRRYFIIAYHFIYGETPNMPGWFEKLTGDLGIPIITSIENKMDKESEPKKVQCEEVNEKRL